MKRNTKRQGGYTYPRAGWWVLRYRDDVLQGGTDPQAPGEATHSN
jgi:hypothetical protein